MIKKKLRLIYHSTGKPKKFKDKNKNCQFKKIQGRFKN
jgi:hypothetical protein